MTDVTLTVSADSVQPYNLGATGLEEIAQNVRVILSTVRGQLFLDRTFGIPISLVDTPATKVRAQLVNVIIGEVEKQEPRVQVTAVSFDQSDKANGEVSPSVSLKVRKGVLLE